MDDKYIGKICPYCKTEIKSTDEIVLCSSCDMPHHKECWVANEGCTTFGCTGTIQGVDDTLDDKKKEPVIGSGVVRYCTKCGAPHGADDYFCGQCGNPLKSNQGGRNSQDNGAYYTNNNSGNSYGSYIGNNSYSTYNSNSNGYGSYTGQGAYDMPGGSMEESFVKNNYYYYKGSFDELRSRQKEIKWNWAAFFLSSYWCFYRRMYKLGGILAGISLISSLIEGIGPIITLGISIYMGLYGNKNYMNYVDESLKEIQKLPDNLKEEYMKKKGGTSTESALAAVGVMFILGLLLAL